MSEPSPLTKATVYTQVELPPLIPPYKGGKQKKCCSLPFIRGGLGWGKTEIYQLLETCVYTVAYQGRTTGGLKRSQILTNDLGLLYKQQIPQSHVEVLESHVEVLESHVEVLENRVEVLESRVEVLESHVEVLENRVEVLESRVEVLESRVEVLENRVEVLENRVEVLENRVGVFQTLSHRDQVHRYGLRLRLTFKTVATIILK
ncbi:hypothetical protein [Nostoc sp.]|uniref:hypothetical protein n=1 Tax=Nostoc sp. TaxID=1180 RepID=UPI002FFC4556